MRIDSVSPAPLTNVGSNTVSPVLYVTNNGITDESHVVLSLLISDSAGKLVGRSDTILLNWRANESRIVTFAPRTIYADGYYYVTGVVHLMGDIQTIGDSVGSLVFVGIPYSDPLVAGIMVPLENDQFPSSSSIDPIVHVRWKGQGFSYHPRTAIRMDIYDVINQREIARTSDSVLLDWDSPAISYSQMNDGEALVLADGRYRFRVIVQDSLETNLANDTLASYFTIGQAGVIDADQLTTEPDVRAWYASDGTLLIDYRASDDVTLTLSVLDIAGRSIMPASTCHGRGRLVLDAKDLSAGLYFVHASALLRDGTTQQFVRAVRR
jgi:hypothetical protein